MKFIHTFWSCNEPDFLKWGNGWFAPEYHLMSWALSCLQLKKYHDEVTLYTDSFGAKILSDVLQLPYSSVICNLDTLNSYHSQLWALPKIYTYAAQNVPFLHVDGDVFIWKKFDELLLSGDLIAQNLEIIPSYYNQNMQVLEKELIYFPSEIMEDRMGNNPICAYNAGIFGGNDLHLLKFYSEKAIQFVDRNKNNFSNIQVNIFNRFFEQYLFYCIVKKRKAKVNVLITDVIGENGYNGFGDFGEIPHSKQFIHLLGGYKSGKWICEQLADRLRHDYPKYYYRIISFFKTRKLPLFRSYYYFSDHISEEHFVQSFDKLKDKFQNNSLQIFNSDMEVNSSPPVTYTKGIVYKLLVYKKENGALNDGVFVDKLIKDAQIFDYKLTSIVNDKFGRYSFEYLYARDLSQIQYLQHIFEGTKILQDKIIVADKLVEIIKSEYDWIGINEDTFNPEKIEVLKTTSGAVYTAVIPECGTSGYSLINLNAFDMLLLNKLKRPISIKYLTAEIKNEFEAAELEECSGELERWILERIEKYVMSKTIKVLIATN